MNEQKVTRELPSKYPLTMRLVVDAGASEEEALAIMLKIDLTKNDAPYAFTYDGKTRYMKVEEVTYEKTEDSIYTILLKGHTL